MDVGDPGQRTIRLAIKTPNQVREDLVLEDIRPSWTVRELKAHLSAVYATKPAVSDQRLIYAGKLLPDHLQLKDIFRQTDPTPTLHLVCTYRSQQTGSQGARENSAASTSAGMSTAAQTPSSPELRHRRPTPAAAAAAAAAPSQTQTSAPWNPAWPTAAAAAAAAAAPVSPPITQPSFPNYSLYSPQQLLWLQHVYARQYYMQYHAALAAAGSAPSTPASVTGQFPPVPAHQVPVPAPLANQNPIDNLPANQNQVQDAAAFINPGEANQNMRMNAQGGAVMEDEDAVERDWLDWLYSLSRFCVLLMIVYFNSNLSRFLMVMVSLLVMYLHTAGLFPFRRPQVQAPDHLQAPEVQHNQQNENRNPAMEQVDGQGEEPNADAADGPDAAMTAVLVPPHRVSVVWTAWVFFKSFFSSLIPEVPQGVAN